MLHKLDVQVVNFNLISAVYGWGIWVVALICIHQPQNKMIWILLRDGFGSELKTKRKIID